MERQEVLQQKLEHWCSATVRALADKPSVHYRGHHLIVDEKLFQLQTPHLQLDFATVDSRLLRGVADSIALRLIHSDAELHRQLQPSETIEQLVFELLEQLRCESLMPEKLPGIRSNLRERFLFWARQTASSPLMENDIGLLIFTLNVVCWSRLLKQTIPELIEDVIEATRWGFSNELRQSIYTLSKVCHDQQAFAVQAIAIAKEINQMIELVSIADDSDSEGKATKKLNNSRYASLKWFNDESVSSLEDLRNTYATSRPEIIVFDETQAPYRVYNRAYDREVNIVKVIRAEQLKKFRTRLDKRIRQQSVNVHRVARHLQHLFATPALSGWSFGQEEGYLDSARLARLVTNPHDHRLFRKEQHQPAMDCIVSIVIDNSGSMIHHNEAIAGLVDLLAQALELAKVKTEILGFTTVDWNGGKVFKEWVAAGKPDNPGRLTSIRHTVYKALETPWRRSRPAIAGMLRSDLFKEGIDGEALQWAVKRIENKTASNKIILMISDGSPMDTSTLQGNAEHYLDRHLVSVAHGIEKRSDIKLCGLGVGLDLSTYYRESMSISLNNELDTNDFISIAELLNRAV